MAESDFSAALHEVFQRAQEDAARHMIELGFRFNVYQSESGPRAIVSVTAGLMLPICLECQQPSPQPFSEWRNQPGVKGVRYVCPDCHTRLSAPA